MNYDLAMMALEGLTRTRLSVSIEGDSIRIEAGSAAFKELARLCLLLGSEAVKGGEEFELKPGVHLEAASRVLRLRLR